MEKGNWIKMYRKILKWEWYRDTNTKCVFFHLLFIANFCDLRFEGRIVKRGQVVTSLAHLSRDLNLSVQKVRTALNHLKSTGEIAVETTSKYTMITLLKYDLYQGSDQVINKQITNEQQTDNKQLTNDQQQVKKLRNKEVNNSISQEVELNCPNHEIKNIENGTAIPTYDEILEYCRSNDLNVNISRFYEYYDNYHWKYADKPVDWKKQLHQWHRTEFKPKRREEPKGINDLTESYDFDELENYCAVDYSNTQHTDLIINEDRR